MKVKKKEKKNKDQRCDFFFLLKSEFSPNFELKYNSYLFKGSFHWGKKKGLKFPKFQTQKNSKLLDFFF